MNPLKRFAAGDMRLNRIEAFSDGVFAIVVTLLVLEFKVPELHAPADAGELLRYLCTITPQLLSWLISFVIVCKFWLNHNYILSLARSANYALVWLNSIFLMSQAFVPFPTALMGRYPHNPLAVSLFGCVMAISTCLFVTLHMYIRRHLIKPEFAESLRLHSMRKHFAYCLFYLLGAAAAWIDIRIAFLLYATMPLFSITPPQPKKAA